MKQLTRNSVFAIIFLSLVAGCSSSGEDPTRYYIIEPVAGAGTQSMEALAIAVVDLEIPQYLERFQIASRRTDNQLAFASSHQWAESLRKNLSRSLARNLATFLGTPDVGTPASRSSSVPDYRLSLSIERFERDADGYVQLVARWQVTKGTSRESLTTRSTHLSSDRPVASKDFAGTVSEMSQLFADLSVEIGQAILEMR